MLIFLSILFLIFNVLFILLFPDFMNSIAGRFYMSVGPNQPVDINLINQAHQRVNRLEEEIAQLSDQELAPAEYYGEFLQRILSALEAPAGAVWVRTPQGNLQLQYQIKMAEVGVGQSPNARQMHDELLRQAAMKGLVGLPPCPPQSGTGAEKGPGNPTDFFILLAPIIYDKQVAGLVEVWHHPMRGPDAMRAFLNWMRRMANLASGYTRNHQLRQMVGQQQVWVQLESFARQIHGSLNPIEVAYLVVNEGRRLIEADRISVAMRFAQKPVVHAISGADVVERRSNLVQLMRRLMEEVLKWGERLIYSGTKDDSLPPGVLKALDLYLAESNSKLLVVMPLKDERETKAKSKKPARSVLMMECFEPNANTEQLLARMDVIGRHAAPALYNAVEHRRIPFRFIWMPLAKVQEGLGGKTKAIVAGIGAAIVALIFALVLVPYPLKMEAKGQSRPEDCAYVYAPVEGQVIEIPESLKSGDYVAKDKVLVRMFDLKLQQQINTLINEHRQAQAEFEAYSVPAPNANLQDNAFRRNTAEATRDAKKRELDEFVARTNADPEHPGEFSLKAPIAGIILTPDFRETLKGRTVKPNEQLIRIGKVAENPKKRESKEWLVDLKIPQKHVGQILEACARLRPCATFSLTAGNGAVMSAGVAQGGIRTNYKVGDRLTVVGGVSTTPCVLEVTEAVNGMVRGVKIHAPGSYTRLPANPVFVTGGDGTPHDLDVDLLARLDPTKTFKGKLARNKIAFQANVNRDDNNEPDPVVQAWVRLTGDDIAPQDQLTPNLLVAGGEITTRVRCGNHALGYSLFYGVWEFVYEKLVFWLT